MLANDRQSALKSLTCFIVVQLFHRLGTFTSPHASLKRIAMSTFSIVLFVFGTLVACVTCANPSIDSIVPNPVSSGIYLLPSADAPKTTSTAQTVYIALLLPLHRSADHGSLPSWARNRTSAVCSSELNSAAVYDLEAALWTLDRLQSIHRPNANAIPLQYRLIVVDSCEQTALLAQRIQSLLVNPKWSSVAKRMLTVVSSTPAEQLLGVIPLLSAHNLTLLSAQDLTWALSGQVSPPPSTSNEPLLKLLQTALPPSHYAQTAVAFLRGANRHRFSIIHGSIDKSGSAANGLLRTFVRLLETLDRRNTSDPSINSSRFCMQSVVSLPTGGVAQDSASASQVLMQLQHDLLLLQEHAARHDQLIGQQSTHLPTMVSPATSNNDSIIANKLRPSNISSNDALEEERLRLLLSAEDEELDTEELDEEAHVAYEKASADEQLVLLATESSDTRAVLSSYQHLLHAGLLGPMRFVLLRESNLNVVSGLEQSLLQTIVLREHQPSLVDFVHHFARLRTSSSARRNPFFAQFWQEAARCTNADCQFQQIEPVHTLNTMQAVALAVQATTTWKDRLCVTCSHVWSLESLPNIRQHLLQHVLGRNWPMSQLSDHFTGTLRFEPAPHCTSGFAFCPAIPLKSIDVLRFRPADSHFRFDRLQTVPLTGPASISLFDSGVNLKLNRILNQTMQKLYCVDRSNLLTKASQPLDSSASPSSAAVWTSAASDHSTIDSLRQWGHAISVWQLNSKERALAEVLSVTGILFVLACFVYLLLTLDRNYGTTVLGYLILCGLLSLYALNLLFLRPSGGYALCWLRSFLMPAAYTLIFAGLLVKVLNAWRLNGLLNVQLLHSALNLPHTPAHPAPTQHASPVASVNTAYVLGYGAPWAENPHCLSTSTTASSGGATYAYASHSARASPRSLLLMCIGLICLQSLTSVLWLAIYPPRAALGPSGAYRCVSAIGSGAFSLLHTDSVSSLLFVSLLLLITVYFALLCWRQPVNQHECRWILFCSYLTAMSWLCWALLIKLHYVHDRDLSIAFTNILVATILFVGLFVRKVFAFERLRRQMNRKSNHSPTPDSPDPKSSTKSSRQRKLGPFGGAFGRYGTLGTPATTNDTTSALQRNKGSIDAEQQRTHDSIDSTSGHRSNDELSNSCDNLDAVSTISGMTTTSSIISSVRGYFRGHQRTGSSASCSAGNAASNKTTSKAKRTRKNDRSTEDTDALESNGRKHANTTRSKHDRAGESMVNGLGAVHLADLQPGHSMIDPMAAELYPMDVYDVSQPMRNNHGATINRTKSDLFNSNRSLYLMDENGFM